MFQRPQYNWLRLCLVKHLHCTAMVYLSLYWFDMLRWLFPSHPENTVQSTNIDPSTICLKASYTESPVCFQRHLKANRHVTFIIPSPQTLYIYSCNDFVSKQAGFMLTSIQYDHSSIYTHTYTQTYTT